MASSSVAAPRRHDPTSKSSVPAFPGATKADRRRYSQILRTDQRLRMQVIAAINSCIDALNESLRLKPVPKEISAKVRETKAAIKGAEAKLKSFERKMPPELKAYVEAVLKRAS
jgi:hypothetical protein